MGFFPHPRPKELPFSQTQLRSRVHRDSSPMVRGCLVVEIGIASPNSPEACLQELHPRISCLPEPPASTLPAANPAAHPRAFPDHRNQSARGSMGRAGLPLTSSATGSPKAAPWGPRIREVDRQYDHHIVCMAGTSMGLKQPPPREPIPSRHDHVLSQPQVPTVEPLIQLNPLNVIGQRLMCKSEPRKRWHCFALSGHNSLLANLLRGKPSCQGTSKPPSYATSASW
jgi:hypothetical protein